MTTRTAFAAIAAVALASVVAVTAGPTLAQGWGGGPGWGQGQGQGAGMGRGAGRQAADAPWRQRFASLDENGDGVVTRDELTAFAGNVFAAMDSDGDGKLTLAEYQGVRLGPANGRNPERAAQRQDRKVARFAPMDTNRDGFVSRDEFLAAHGSVLFTAMDRDRDGRVTPAEFRRHGW